MDQEKSRAAQNGTRFRFVPPWRRQLHRQPTTILSACSRTLNIPTAILIDVRASVQPTISDPPSSQNTGPEGARVSGNHYAPLAVLCHWRFGCFTRKTSPPVPDLSQVWSLTHGVSTHQLATRPLA